MRLAPRRKNNRYRDRAIDALQITPGQCVLDVGCGLGPGFEGLRARVGEVGTVIGIDEDRDAVERAATLTARRGWSNVRTVHQPAAACDAGGMADAALFAFVDDLLLDPAAVLNVLRQLRPHARVASVGREAAQFHQQRPWKLLASYLSDFVVKPLDSRRYYVAHGHIAPMEARPGPGA